MTANTARNHKDTLFSSLFYDCKDAVQNAKDLYKALTGKTVQNAEKCRLEDVLFREFKNDVAYILTEYLKFYGSEVVNMLYTEYDSELAMQVRSQEEYEKGIAEGRAEGKAIGRAEGKAIGREEGKAIGEANMLKKLQKLGNTVKQLAEMFEMSESEVEKLLSMD